CGGFGDFESDFGDLTISADIKAEGADPDGGGGDLGFTARGSITLPAAATISVRANGAMGCGGDVELDAGLDVVRAGIIDTSGGFGGNFLDVTAARNATFTGRIDASGRNVGGYGG